MESSIFISVITATKNSSLTIASSVKSFTKQSYNFKEQILIDSLSTDRTIEIAKQVNPDVIIISEKDFGIYDALNKGIRASNGNIIGFLHSDDEFYSNDVLSKISKIFEDKSICAVYGDLVFVKKKNSSHVVRRWRSSMFKKCDLRFGWMPAHPTLYVRKDLYGIIGNFDVRYKISSDYKAILQLFQMPDFKSFYLSEVMIKMRLGGASNGSLPALYLKFKEDWAVLRECEYSVLGATIALTGKNLRKILQFIYSSS
jgi:glycosyltransferase